LSHAFDGTILQPGTALAELLSIVGLYKSKSGALPGHGLGYWFKDSIAGRFAFRQGRSLDDPIAAWMTARFANRPLARGCVDDRSSTLERGLGVLQIGRGS
jgi:hypothetical protein